MIYTFLILIVIILPIIVGLFAAYFGGDKVYNANGRFKGMRPNVDFFITGIIVSLKIYLWLFCIVFAGVFLLAWFLISLAKKS